MKKSHRLFRDIGNIPGEYIDDALSGRIVEKHRNHYWRVFLSAAAVFAAVVVVPLSVSLNNRGSDDQADDAPPYVTDISTSEENAYTEILYGTGPEKPDGYVPDKIYSDITLNWKNAVERDGVIKRFDFISDKEFVEEIAGYIEEKSAPVIAKMDSKLSEKEKTELNIQYGSIDQAEYFSCKVVNIINGYMTVDVTATVGYDYQIDTYVFDIIEGRIIENYSDLFWKDENITELFYSIMDRPEETERVFGISGGVDFFWKKRREYGSDTKTFFEDRLLDSMICGIYRDASSAVNCEVTDKEWTEWHDEQESILEIDGHEVQCMLDKSVFYSDDEITEHNNEISEIFEAAVRRMFEDGILSDDNPEPGNLYIENLTGVLSNILSVRKGGLYDVGILVDPENHNVVGADEILRSWQNYVTEVRNHSWNLIKNPDLSKYNVSNIELNRIYVMPDEYYESYISREYAADYIAVIPEGEAEFYDRISFRLFAVNPETGEKITIIIMLPVENVDSRYFNREAYTEVLNEWYV